ncbi:MAG TPA: hypothetical protein VGS19_04975 [Streptosporangiaceae bacterium]|nr:hypothetical protein [Streptosporangiaceae bacterium]
MCAAVIAASVLLMAAASAAGPSLVVPALPQTWPVPPWWLPLHLSRFSAGALTWAAVLLGAVGVGCGLVAVRRGARPPARLLLAAGLTAVALFTVLPPAGSTDSLSYAAQGRIVLTGHSPYLMTPAQLRASGDPVGLQGTRNWADQRSVYGPLATAGEWAAAELGGESIGRIVFWLKVWLALAFGGVALLLDWVLRAQPAERARAHLLWSVNPLMLWAVMAGGHVDGLAACLGLAGLVAACRTRLGWAAALGAGVLVGAAALVKILFGVFLAGAGWVSRRSPAALAAGGLGAGLTLGTGYLIAGPTALRNLRSAGSWQGMDGVWRIVTGFGSMPTWLSPVALLACVALATLLAWRLPPGLPALPAIRAALALTLAWLLLWPMQRSWYDASVYCLLAVFPASRLDWVLLVRSVPTTLDLIMGHSAPPSVAMHPLSTASRPSPHGRPGAGLLFGWLRPLTAHTAELLVVPVVRLGAVLAVVVLCVTAAWGTQPPGPDGLDGEVQQPRPGSKSVRQQQAAHLGG